MAKRQGFAAISPERRREISRQGAKAQRAAGKAPRFTTETGRAAGLVGGKVHGEIMHEDYLYRVSIGEA